MRSNRLCVCSKPATKRLPRGVDALCVEGWLKEIEERYSDAFAEFGPGCLSHSKNFIDNVDAFLDLLRDRKIDFRVKLVDYAKICSNVLEIDLSPMAWKPVDGEIESRDLSTSRGSNRMVGETRDL